MVLAVGCKLVAHRLNILYILSTFIHRVIININFPPNRCSQALYLPNLDGSISTTGNNLVIFHPHHASHASLMSI